MCCVLGREKWLSFIWSVRHEFIPFLLWHNVNHTIQCVLFVVFDFFFRLSKCINYFVCVLFEILITIFQHKHLMRYSSRCRSISKSFIITRWIDENICILGGVGVSERNINHFRDYHLVDVTWQTPINGKQENALLWCFYLAINIRLLKQCEDGKTI